MIKRHYVPESNDHHDNCVKQRICYNLVNGNAKPDDDGKNDDGHQMRLEINKWAIVTNM